MSKRLRELPSMESFNNGDGYELVIQEEEEEHHDDSAPINNNGGSSSNSSNSSLCCSFCGCDGRCRINREDPVGYFNTFPVGLRFNPTDEELIGYYLTRKINNQQLPPNLIGNVKLYNQDPEQLTANQPEAREGEWYFFTPRDKKYANGSRPNRAAGRGFWKATGKDKIIYDENGKEIGSRMSLVFQEGKPKVAKKTDWIMQEFVVKKVEKKDNDENGEIRPTDQNGKKDMRLDDYVLCKLRKKDKPRVTQVRGDIPNEENNNDPLINNNNNHNHMIIQENMTPLEVLPISSIPPPPATMAHPPVTIDRTPATIVSFSETIMTYLPATIGPPLAAMNHPPEIIYQITAWQENPCQRDEENWSQASRGAYQQQNQNGNQNNIQELGDDDFPSLTLGNEFRLYDDMAL